jgi:uncharacterized RDD family membrane protein YckC
MTGEAVALDVRAASFATRTVSFVIDAVLTGLLLWGAVWALSKAAPTLNEASGTAAIIALVAFFLVVLPALVETWWRGRTPGKWVMGYRIVTDDGGPIHAREAFVRAAAGLFELWLTAGGIALIVSMLNLRGKRVGDYLAGTYAARVRGVRLTIQPVITPPALAHWAAGADIAGLPDGLALAARQFLGRAEQLSPSVRASLGTRLAAAVEPHVAPAPPLGTPPEAYLAAVIATRRDRERAAEQRRAARTAALLAPAATLGYGISDPPA